MLRLENVTVAYRARRVLENITFTASPGEITVLLGRNGCGKSTLLRALAGCVKYSGSVVIGTRRAEEISRTEHAKLISMMAQSPKVPDMTVRELVLCARRPYTGFLGSLSDSDRIAADRAISEVGIEALADRMLSEISGGELQKAHFAMLAAQNTPVILLDEPTSSLDTVNRTELADALRRFADSGKTVLAVLHDINLALSIADRVVVLAAHENEPSRVALCGSADDFRASDLAERVFALKAVSGVYYM